jgi:hypothetical protein
MANTADIGDSHRPIRAAGKQPSYPCAVHQEIVMSNAAFHTPAESQPDDASGTGDDFNRILALAREAGMLVTLDGQIGREKYQSIAGSLNAFRRFAQALCNATAQVSPQ